MNRRIFRLGEVKLRKSRWAWNLPELTHAACLFAPLHHSLRSEEERVLLEFRQKVSEARGVLDSAATRIQKVARGRATRALLKAATKGKKGKGGKKKK